MRVAAVLVLLAATLTSAIHSPAQAQDITRACFPGFCVEAREAYMTIARDPAKGEYRLRMSRTQSIVYLKVGTAPPFPHCGATCAVETAGAEKRALQNVTRRLVARLIGPIEPCKGEAFFVHVFVYNTEANPDWLEIIRECG
jgi:hypothetical protein